MYKIMEYGFINKYVVFLIRLWLGAIMLYSGRVIFTYGQDVFWHHFFRDELNFPFPDLMFYLAKGSEFIGGLFLFFGLMTRFAAGIIASTMLVATIFANSRNIYGGYGGITFSYFLFAAIFIFTKPIVWSIDEWISKHKSAILTSNGFAGAGSIYFRYLLTGMRIWFASQLVYNGFHAMTQDQSSLFFNWPFRQSNVGVSHITLLIGAVAEIVFGCFIGIGLFSRLMSRIVALLMFIAWMISYTQGVELSGFYLSMVAILFWLAAVFSLSKTKTAS